MVGIWGRGEAYGRERKGKLSAPVKCLRLRGDGHSAGVLKCQCGESSEMRTTSGGGHLLERNRVEGILFTVSLHVSKFLHLNF